jgi:putative transposase
VIRTYQYRLYPRKHEKIALEAVFQSARFLYNHTLAYRRKCWSESRQHVSYKELSGMWRDWRNEQPDDNPLRVLNMTAGQQVLRRLEKTYNAFFRGGGFPRFKGRDRFNSVDYTYGDGCKVTGNRLYIQNVGDLKIKLHRPLPENGTIKMVNIKRKASGWYVNLQIELPNRRVLHNGQSLVGIDMGLSRLLTLSDGTWVDNPRWLKTSLAKLRVAQRTLARRKMGSKRRRKARHQVALLHEHVANTRRDFWHKVTTYLVNTYGGIGIEDLKLGFMLKNKHLSQSAHDAGLGLFTQLLHSKAESAGCVVLVVNPKNTSQACSGCGVTVPKALSVRVHHCPHCNLVLDRDENAARNIFHLAFKSAWTVPSGAVT